MIGVPSEAEEILAGFLAMLAEAESDQGAARDGSMPSSTMAACTTSGDRRPWRANSLRTATTRWAASTSKCARSAARASERPKPSVPSEV